MTGLLFDLINPAPVFDRDEAGRRKAKGQERGAISLNPIRARVDAYIETLAADGQPFTADDLYALADQDGYPLGEGINLGPAFTAAAARRLIVPVWCPARASERPSTHGRALKVWQGGER